MTEKPKAKRMCSFLPWLFILLKQTPIGHRLIPDVLVPDGLHLGATASFETYLFKGAQVFHLELLYI
jgi:hypothetical protein